MDRRSILGLLILVGSKKNCQFFSHFGGILVVFTLLSWPQRCSLSILMLNDLLLSVHTISILELRLM